jgi:PleD family two-component response regulator
MEKIKVIVADDHGQNATFIATSLENVGFKCFEAASADEAIRIAKREDVKIIIANTNVDRVKAYELAKQNPDKKIIMLDGDEEDLKQASKTKNIIGIIEKPVDVSKIADIIKKIT